MKMKEICNGAIAPAIEGVRERAADGEGQPGAEEAGIGAIPPDAEADEGRRDEKRQRPERDIAEEAVGNAGIPDEDVVEEIR